MRSRRAAGAAGVAELPVAGDAVTDGLEAAELLEVDLQEFARMITPLDNGRD